MIDTFKEMTFVKELLSSLEKSNSILIESLWDSPKALLLEIVRSSLNRSLVVVTGGDRENRLYDDLLFFNKERVFEFPSWEVLPGEEISPSPDIMGKRFEILHEIAQISEPIILLTSVQSLLQKVVSSEEVFIRYETLAKGQEVSFETVIKRLEVLGYKKSKLVIDKGYFAVRGGIIDIFPIGSLSPCRIEFFGDAIEEIRLFDPISQTSVEKITSIQISPADEKGSELVPLLSYLGDAILVFDDLLKIEDRVVSLLSLPGSKTSYMLSFDEILNSPHKKVFWSDAPIESLSQEITKKGNHIAFTMFSRPMESIRLFHPFQKLGDFFEAETIAEGVLKEENKTLSSILIGDGEAQITHLKELFKGANGTFINGYLSSGFAVRSLDVALIPHTELTHRLKVRRDSWRSSYHTPPSEYHKIEVGDFVVHFHSGIGRYLGVEKQKNHLGVESEFLIIEYAENSKLFVPASQSYLVSRYIGTGEETPTLHKLGSSQWQNMKTKAQTAIIGYAKDLLNIQAERELKGGFSYPEVGELTREFAKSFPYSETQDQLHAIHDIYQDMSSEKAMDRLICGDVGYGKTEVAMRAAFRAAAEGHKQVAVLVPTTVLAMQHYETFSQRMSLFPVTIKVISRFQKPSEIKKILEETKEGKVDILIGTHRLISKDIDFKDLGLLIIDEEQRFGVRAKESLKKLKANVDTLTMTATPIPRTLYFSLIGARNMSVINSPPQDRLPIKSILCEREEGIIKNALLREFAREGQAYFIHNRVESIHKIAEELQKLAPEAKIGVVHGQMSSDIIDDIFHQFKSGELNLLVATTIIENGIDIPNANTILIDRADTFGIADLYQLRGRVGRWNKTAYAYFLTPQNRTLPEISQKRLSAIAQTSGFGGGMALAMKDLEIRGAGDILGVQQSGHVASIGFHLYCKLLKRAIDALKKKTQSSFIETKMEFTFDARLPDTYISDSSIRLEIYHRLGEAEDNEIAKSILNELIDRFGPPPTPVFWLYHMTRIRIFASSRQFTLLKFLKLTLLAERKYGNQIEKKSLFFKEDSSPESFERQIIDKLSSEFALT